MPTVRVVVVVFYSVVCAAFCVVFRAVCSASTRVRQRGTVAAPRGERGDGKIARSSQKSCFSAGQLFGRIAVKKSSGILLFDFFVKCFGPFFLFLLIFE